MGSGDLVAVSDAGPLIHPSEIDGLALLFALIARMALRHAWLSRPVQLYGHYITPLILITVGLFVLSNTAVDVMPGT